MGLRNSNGVIPMVRRSPRGDYTSIAEGYGGTFTIALYFSIIIFFGILTTYLQTLRGFGIGIFYMLLTVMTMAIWWIESTTPKTRAVAIVDLGKPITWILSFPIGIVFGIATAYLLRMQVGTFLAFETLSVFGVPLEVILQVAAPVVAIPIAEEAFFGGVLTPTLTEELGLLPASTLVGLVWVLWHLGTYSSSISILVMLFVFRFFATFLIIETESLFGVIVAHIIINFFGTFYA